MIIHEDMKQRTPEWFQIRLGKLTGTGAADMLATIKSGEAAARRDLRMRLVCERLTGQSQEDGYINAAMQRGIDLEPQALAAYEAVTGNVAWQVGFVEENDAAGCSPDGLIRSVDPLDEMEGVVSLKCPKSATHLKYLQGGLMPSEYVPQMLHELWITNAYYYDFLSFDDRFPAKLQTFWIRTERRKIQAQVDEYARKAAEFLLEVDALTAALNTVNEWPKALEQAATA